jgi:hypothetical protein
MKTANIIVRLNSGAAITILKSETINEYGSFSCYVPRFTIGQRFEVHAYTNDVNRGSITVVIQ